MHFQQPEVRHQQLVVLDTNVWIEASQDAASPSTTLLGALQRHGFRVGVSKHSLAELESGSDKYGAAAWRLACEAELLPNYPIGRISELLGKIGEMAGTISEMRLNESVREALSSIAKAGTDIRDRGALIDAWRSEASYFVSYDNGIVSAGPRSRIALHLSLTVQRPQETLDELRKR